MEKRTFSDFSTRILQLRFRQFKVESKFIILRSFYPFKALFIQKRVQRILNGLQAQIVMEYKKGYWI